MILFYYNIPVEQRAFQKERFLIKICYQIFHRCNAFLKHLVVSSFLRKKDLGHTVIQPLPLYHIYACTLSMLMISLGQHCVLIPNPRDLSSMIKAMKPWNFSVFCGLNTLFVSLCSRDDFKRLDFFASCFNNFWWNGFNF